MYQFTGQGQDLLLQARQLHTDSNDYRAKRRYQKAADALEQAYKLRRTALISPHAVLTATVDALSHLYQEMGVYDRWHHFAKLAVTEKVGMLGELHTETQSALDNLAEACVAMGDHEGAAEARSRNWHSRTSTLGIKDEAVEKNGLVGDIERMLDHLRKMVPSIRRSADTEDLETRLRISQGSVSTQAQVAAAQTATHALMHCDFNDRRPVKRDHELERLLADRMTPADYLLQFGRPPDTRWRSGSQVWRDSEGLPGTPPAEDGTGASRSASAPAPPSSAGEATADEIAAAEGEEEGGEEGEEETPIAPPEEDEVDAPPAEE